MRGHRTVTLNKKPAVYGTTAFCSNTSSSEIRTHQNMNLNNEPAVYGTTTFCGNAASNVIRAHWTMNLNNESSVHGTTAFCGNTVFNDMETYQSMNLNTEPAVYDITAFHGNTESNDVESHQIMNLEHEVLRHNCYTSCYKPIILVVCGKGSMSPISSKTASGVVSFNNETINAQNMEHVDMYHGQPDTSRTLKVTTNPGANEFLSPFTFMGCNESCC